MMGIAVSASGNGRPPHTNGVFFHPTDPNTLLLRTSFGLLISHDDGCSFRWVCEQNIGYGGTFDPKYAVSPSGAIFATTFTGLRVSRDAGCSFATATEELLAGSPERLSDRYLGALAVGSTGEVWVGTADTLQNAIYRSTDDGVTFAVRGTLPPAILWESIRVAPTDPARVYITGGQVNDPPSAYFYATTNAGADWTAGPLGGVVLGASPIAKVMAVDPVDPNILYLLTVGSQNNGAGDRLYRSGDAGQTFIEVLTTPSTVVGVTVHAETVTVATQAGAFSSTDRGLTFQPVAAPLKFACLVQRTDGRYYACGANWEPDFMALAHSGDAASWEKIFRFAELAGPVDCPAGTPQAETCGPLYSILQQQFGVTGPTCGAAPDTVGGDVAKSPGSGCCQTGGQGGTVALLGALVAFAAIGPRVRRRRYDRVFRSKPRR